MTTPPVEKVTAFITRSGRQGAELLLFEHPFAGNQFPAGTVEIDESPVAAMQREVAEETGLRDARLLQHIGSRERELPETMAAVWRQTRVFARPDAASFDWAFFRRGIWLQLTGRRRDGFAQVNYTEHDRLSDPRYVTMSITGWVPETVLTTRMVRHFYHLDHPGDSEARWPVRVDNHTFTLFWALLDDMPALAAPQDRWLELFLSYWVGSRYA